MELTRRAFLMILAAVVTVPAQIRMPTRQEPEPPQKFDGETKGRCIELRWN